MIPMIIMAIEDEDDRSFMANLYVDYQRLMYKVITSYTTNKWDADDIFQSTLPKLIDKLADLRRMSKDKLTNYIYSTCKNTAINYLQKKGGLKEFSFEELSSTMNTVPLIVAVVFSQTTTPVVASRLICFRSTEVILPFAQPMPVMS